MAKKLLVRMSVERARDPKNDLTAKNFIVYSFADVDSWQAFQGSAIARPMEGRPSLGMAKYWDFDIGFETDF